MKKKTIAIIGESYVGSGPGLYTVELFKGINKSERYEAKLFLRNTAPFYDPNVVRVKNFNIRRRVLWSLGYYIPLFFKLLKYRKSIDMIHAYDEKTSFIARFLGKPQIVNVYDLQKIFDTKVYYKFPLKYLFKLLYNSLNKSKLIIVISDHVGNALKEAYPTLSEKIVTIYLGTDVNRFKPVAKKKKAYLNVGILGSLDKELWNVFERLLEEYGKEIKIVLGGAISKEFDFLKSHPNVIFKSYIEESELAKHYQDIDIFVYKTDTGVFDLITVEAMASGCALVTSKVGALPGEIVKNGGLLVENTEEGFYEGIKKVIDNKKLREEYQKNGRKRAEELTWDKCTEKHLEIYDKILADGK